MDIALGVGTLTIAIVLGVIVYVQDRRSVQNTLFLLMCACIGVWISSNFITNHTYGYSIDVNQVANSIAFAAGFLTVTFGLLFSYAFSGRLRVSFFELALVFGVATGMVLLSFTHFVAGDVYVKDGMVAFENGPLVIVYAVFFLLFLAILAYNLLWSMKRANPRKRSQALLILMAFLFSAVFGLGLNVIVPLFSASWDTTRIGPVAIVILVGVIAYSIVKQGLFDIKTAVIRSVAYGFSIVMLAGVYYGLAYVASLMFFQGQVSAEVSVSPFNIVLALVLAFLFQPIKTFFDRITDTIFFRDRYDTDDFYARLNEVLTSTTELRGLLQRVAHEIGATLKAKQAFFFVQYAHHHVSAGTKGHTLVPLADVAALNKYIDENGDGVIVSDLLDEHEPVRRLLESHRIALIMPLVRSGTTLGYLALGDHGAGIYTERDIKVLRTVSHELIIAIQNALSVQEIKDINTTLQQRIAAATKELTTSNAQLRHLDTTKDEFLSMASHQLRTPLTSVKGYISMVLEGDTGKITEAQRQLLTEAFASSERMVHLIHDFLNVSRLQTGKFTLERHPVDLDKLVSEEVRSLQRVAEPRGITIKYVRKGDIPELIIDESKIQQVVMNYIDNAIYYSRAEMKPIEVRLERVGEAVELKVIDTGIGVPKSEQAKLFNRFFRASNARKQRPDGTGVGIYLAKKVVTAHGGDIIFTSQEGKGSTFGFRLPLDINTAG